MKMINRNFVFFLAVVAMPFLLVQAGLSQESKDAMKKLLQKKEASISSSEDFVINQTKNVSAAEVNIILFKVESETIATTPSNRDRKTIGIGEEVKL